MSAAPTMRAPTVGQENTLASGIPIPQERRRRMTVGSYQLAVDLESRRCCDEEPCSQLRSRILAPRLPA